MHHHNRSHESCQRGIYRLDCHSQLAKLHKGTIMPTAFLHREPLGNHSLNNKTQYEPKAEDHPKR